MKGLLTCLLHWDPPLSNNSRKHFLPFSSCQWWGLLSWTYTIAIQHWFITHTLYIKSSKATFRQPNIFNRGQPLAKISSCLPVVVIAPCTHCMRTAAAVRFVQINVWHHCCLHVPAHPSGYTQIKPLFDPGCHQGRCFCGHTHKLAAACRPVCMRP